MRWYKLKALMKRDFQISVRAKWRFAELFYFPLSTVIIWGLFAVFTRDFSASTGLMVLAINVFWSFSYLSQSNTNMLMNQDHWSGSLKQVLASGISEFEYISARIISSTIMALIVMIVMLFVSLGFGLGIFFEQPGITMALIGVTLFGSIAMSIIVAALIMYLGREYSFLAWTLLQIFILLSAPLYPLTILPEVLQTVALAMPYTQVFLGVRMLIDVGTVPVYVFVNGILVVFVYLILSIPIYYLSFRRARKNGMLVDMG